MFLIKLIGKMLLLPMILLLGILRLLVKIFAEISAFVLGILVLFVLACIIFTIVRHTWDSMMILIVTEIFLVLIGFGTGMVQYMLEAASEKLGGFMRS